MITKYATPNILFRPEPKRMKKLFLDNSNCWYEHSNLLTSTLNKNYNNDAQCLKSFSHSFDTFNNNQPKIKNLVHIPKRIELKELILISQELEWRQCCYNIFSTKTRVNVPERPLNPMIKDRLFIRKEKEEVYCTLK